MGETSIHVTTTMKLPVGVVFDALASPYRHPKFDPTGTTVSDESSGPLTKVGQVFRMNLVRADVDGNQVGYQRDNHVTKFKPNRKIAWAPALPDDEPLGWFWRYDLSVKGKRDQKSLVTLTYDWGDATAATLTAYGVPSVGERDLERSLERLEKLLG